MVETLNQNKFEERRLSKLPSKNSCHYRLFFYNIVYFENKVLIKHKFYTSLCDCVTMSDYIRIWY